LIKLTAPAKHGPGLVVTNEPKKVWCGLDGVLALAILAVPLFFSEKAPCSTKTTPTDPTLSSQL
jgi:hypothetical protein